MSAPTPNAAYRVVMSYDRDRNVYVARVPELDQCQAEGPSRAEALARIEQEIEAQLGNIVQSGGQVPRPVDDTPPEDLPIKVSRSLAGELSFQARDEGVCVDQLVGELLAQALEARRHGVRVGAAQPREGGRREAGPPNRERDRGRGERGDRRGISGARYHAVMEDRANFIEYVRSLESNERGPRRK